MADSPNPFQGMSDYELQLRYRGTFYDNPKPPAIPTEVPQPLTRAQMAADPATAQFFPDGASGKIPGLPKQEIDQRQFMPQEQLQREHPEFYEPIQTNNSSGPVSDLPASWKVPDSLNANSIRGLPEIPVEAPPSAPLGSVVPAGAAGGVGALIGGPIGVGLGSAVVGILTGESPDVAVAQGLGAALGFLGGAAAGAAAGTFVAPGAGTGVGGLIGGSFGTVVGGELGRQIGQGIHNFFFGPPPATQSPHDPVQLAPIRPYGQPTQLYNVHATTTGHGNNPFRSRAENEFTYEDLGVQGGPFEGPILAVGFSPPTEVQEHGAGTGYTFIIHGNPARKTGTGNFDYGGSGNVFESMHISNVYALDGAPVPGQEYPPDWQQNPGTFPRMGGLPVGVIMPGTIPQAPPTALPQAAPAPARGPQLEPQRSPSKSPSDDPAKQPSPTPDTNAPFNPNNLPGMFGLPFLPAVMPSNSSSPSGSIKTDPNGAPPGGGKAPPAPPSSPCSGACQRAIEGRIQGVDDKISKLLAGNQAGQDAALAEILSRLAVLDAKVGAQVPTGISGLLQTFKQGFDKFVDWIKLDRLLNIFTFIVTLHNAYMLSNALGQTLFSTIDGALHLFGVHLKGADGKDISVNQLFGNTIENIGKSIFGLQTWNGIKEEWKTFNRIYQAATNILYALQGLFYSVLAAMEVTHSYVASIGNALKKWRVIGHKAFGWMNTSPNFHNSLFTNLNSALMTVSQINFIIQSVEAVKSISEQLFKQGQELEKSVVEDIPKPFKENKPAADADKTTTAGVTPPNITLDNLKQGP